MQSKSPIYWNIIQGYQEKPSPPDLYSTDPDEIRSTLQQNPAPTTNQVNQMITQHNQRNESLLQTYEQERREWQMANYTVLTILRSTLESSPQAQIAGMRDARSAWIKISEVYARSGAQTSMRLWRAWVVTHFHPGGNAEAFVRKFRESLQELRALLKVNDTVEICQFMAAISEAPEAQPFVTQVMLVQHDLTPSMLYNQFQNFMAQTKLQNIFTSNATTKKGKNSANQNTKRPGSSSSNTKIPDEDKNTIWCEHHQAWVSHFPSTCRLKNQKRQSSQQSQSSNQPRSNHAPPRGGSQSRGTTQGRGGSSTSTTQSSRSNNISANATSQEEPTTDYNIDNDSLFVNQTEIVDPPSLPISHGSLFCDDISPFDDIFPNHADGQKCNVIFCNATTTNSVSDPDVSDSDDASHLWMLDSGTSHTMTWMKDHFISFTPCRRPVRTATYQEFWTEGYGDAIIDLLNPTTNERFGTLRLPHTWYAPDLAHNLISIRQLARHGIDTVFDKHEHAQLLLNGTIKAFATTINAHYYLCSTGQTPLQRVQLLKNTGNLTANVTNLVKDPKPIPIGLAHRRTAHASEKKLRLTANHAVGFTLLRGALPTPCEPCLKGKGHSRPVGKSTLPIELKPGDLILTDVCGPFPTFGINGGRYFVTYTDFATRYSWVFIIRERSEVLDKFKILDQYLKVQHNITIKSVHADNAGEHKSLIGYLQATGRIWDDMPPHKPMLNGIPEVKNRHLLEPTIATMSDANLPQNLWEHIVLAVAFIQNRLVHDSIGITPYESLFGTQPDLSKLRALGCKCWYLIPKEDRESKLHPHVSEGRFIGYTENLWKVYDISSRKIVHSRDVTFQEHPDFNIPRANSSYDLDESRLLLHKPPPSPMNGSHLKFNADELIHLRDTDNNSTGSPQATPPPETPLINTHLPNPQKPNWMREYEQTGILPPIPMPDPEIVRPQNSSSNSESSLTNTTEPTQQVILNDSPPSTQTNNESLPAQSPPNAPARPIAPPGTFPEKAIRRLTLNNSERRTEPTRRSERPRKRSRALIESMEAHVVSLMHDPDFHKRHDFLTGLPDDITEQFFNDFPISSNFMTAEGEKYEPQTYQEAMICADAPKWIEARDLELQHHKDNRTWDVVDYKKGMKLLPLRWVWKQKPDRFKARLVAKGFKQKHGRDFHEIFAAVAKQMSVKLFLSLTARFGWLLYHVDIIAAFLHALIKELIYIHLPEGCQEAGKCGRLNKTLYGLKQSPREWFEVLTKFLKSIGFTQTHADVSVFHKDYIFILIYVDDILILAKNHAGITTFLDELKKSFDFHDNGPVRLFLGMDIIQKSDGIFVHQQSYIHNSLHRFGLQNVKPVATPYNSKEILKPNTGTATPDEIKTFQEMIGCLIWIQTGTRPDIAYATSMLARYASNPSREHHTAAVRIWKYLAGTLNLGIFYSSSGDGLQGYVDADWAGPHSTGAASTSGYIFKLAGGPISWTSKKQTSISLSSTEAEYIAMSLATQEALWLQLILSELNINQYLATPMLLTKPTHIQVDNQSAIALSKNPEFHARTKHINIRYHFLREEVANKNIDFIYIPSTKQAADGFTKPLDKIAFKRFVSYVGLRYF